MKTLYSQTQSMNNGVNTTLIGNRMVIQKIIYVNVLFVVNNLNPWSSEIVMWCSLCLQPVDGVNHRDCMEEIWREASTEYTQAREAAKNQYQRVTRLR